MNTLDGYKSDPEIRRRKLFENRMDTVVEIVKFSDDPVYILEEKKTTNMLVEPGFGGNKEETCSVSQIWMCQ